MICLISFPRNLKAETGKPCPSDHTCIKKTTRDLCIKAFNNVKRLKRDCKILTNALKLKGTILLKKMNKERNLYEKRISAISKDLKLAAKKDSRKAFLTGILIGIGSTLVVGATITTVIIVYTK